MARRSRYVFCNESCSFQPGKAHLGKSCFLNISWIGLLLRHWFRIYVVNRLWMYNSVAPCKGIQVSRGFRIPHRGFRIPKVGFRIPSLWIPDSKLFKIPDYKVLNSGFHSFFRGQYFVIWVRSHQSKQEVHLLSKRSKFILLSQGMC